MVLDHQGPDEWCRKKIAEESNMSTLIYILLTVAIFAVLGLSVKLVDRL